MPPKKNALARKTIEARLRGAGDAAPSPEVVAAASTNWLIDAAVRCGVVSDAEAVASRETRQIVLKRYLRTCLADGATLLALDEYVKMASSVRSAGSQLLNLFAIHAYDAGWLDGAHVLDVSGAAVARSAGDGDKDFVARTLVDQTFLKYTLLPFKSALSGRRRDDCPVALLQAWAPHEHVLRPKYPPMADLRRMAWDQALSDMAREMAGAVRAHVLTHLPARAGAFLRARVVEDFGGVVRTIDGRKACEVRGSTFWMADLYDALESGRPVKDACAAVCDEVAGLRARAGLTGSSRLSKASLSDRLFRLHVELSRDAERRRAQAPEDARWRLPKTFSACPVVTTGRTFAYIDDRVMESLIAGFGLERRHLPRQRLFASMLGVDAASWNAASREARRRRRRRLARQGRARRRKRRKRPVRDPGWARHPDPEVWHATSASTDGVAVCVTLTSVLPSTSPDDVPRGPGAAVPASPRPAQGGRHAIAADLGRVVMYEAVQRQGSDGPWTSTRLTRKTFLKLSCQLRREQEEARRREARPHLREAIDSLTAHTWRTASADAFAAMVAAHGAVHDVLKREYVDDDWYARWRMLLWRRKRSVVMRSFADTIQRVAPRGTAVTFGVGNAKFAATGKGERAVPTTTLGRTLLRTARSLSRSYDVEVTEVDEARTTMCCHGCQGLLRDVRGDDGRPLRGLKACYSATCAGAGCSKRHTLLADTSVACGACGATATALKDEDGEVVRGLAVCCHTRECGGAQAFRLRNRDGNAARNMWEVLTAVLEARPRPQYLRRSRRRPQPQTAEPASTSRGPQATT
jgi:hypothetical protein